MLLLERIKTTIANNMTTSSVAYQKLLELAKKAALNGGRAILDIYKTADFGVEMKSDNSPLTKADQAAHNAIVDLLRTTNIPILSEEGKEIVYADRSNWNQFWMIDPLDGTKEFIKRNGEFTVNIALIEKGKPVLGIVYTPVLDKLFYGGTALNGSWLEVNNEPKQLSSRSDETLDSLKGTFNVRIVASRSHRNQDTDDFINSCNHPEIVSMGSSLKFLVVAEGKADIYPRFAPTMEWDTAAADGVLRGLGYKTCQVERNQPTNKPLVYNKENLLNPYFILY